MNKADIVTALAIIADAELVFLKTAGGQMMVIKAVEIQQYEPPIFGVVMTDDLTDAEFAYMVEERRKDQAARAALAAEQAASQEAAQQEFTERVAAVVDAKLAASR